MARMYTLEEVQIGPNDHPTKGHHVFRLRFDPNSIPNVGELVDWSERQPRTGFGSSARAEEFSCSITAHYRSYLWLQNHYANPSPMLDYVDVRVYTDLAAKYFRSVWKIPKQEYQTNMKHNRR